MKLFFVDLETTGLDHIKHGIWQLAAQIWIDGVEQERFKLEMQPVKGKLVSQEAMAKCGIDMVKLKSLPLPHLAFHQLRDRFAGVVHEHLRFCQDNDFVSNFFLRYQNAVRFHLECRKFIMLGKFVNNRKTRAVRRGAVLLPRIS